MVTTVLIIFIVMSSITCDQSPTSASPPAPPPSARPLPEPVDTVNVSGTVWIHEAEGVRPHAGANVYGWIETARWGGPFGRAVTGSDGKYAFRAPVPSLVRIYVASPTHHVSPTYQPCAVRFDVTGDITRDVQTVSDRKQLGASLPPQLRSHFPTLSGMVFEETPEGRRGLSDVRVELDGIGGDGLVIATTLTDSEGRYVLCGLEGDTSTYVYASKPGYPLFGKGVVLTGNATMLDIVLQRR